MTPHDRAQLLGRTKGNLELWLFRLMSHCWILYLWKDMTARNHSGELEGLCNQRIDPRTRLFIAEAYIKPMRVLPSTTYTPMVEMSFMRKNFASMHRL